MSYLLPQNKNGILIVIDMMGKEVYKINLPQWSTLQDLSLSWLTDGVYTVNISSEGSKISKRLVVMK